MDIERAGIVLCKINVSRSAVIFCPAISSGKYAVRVFETATKDVDGIIVWARAFIGEKTKFVISAFLWISGALDAGCEYTSGPGWRKSTTLININNVAAKVSR